MQTNSADQNKVTVTNCCRANLCDGWFRSFKNHFLRDHGPVAQVFENMLFGRAEQMSKSYKGGVWQTVTLSNQTKIRIPPEGQYSVAGSYVDDVELSALTFGIVINLFVSSELCGFVFSAQNNQALNEFLHDYHHAIRDVLNSDLIPKNELNAVYAILD